MKNKTSDKHANIIDQALNLYADNNNADIKAVFALIKSAFLKKDGEILVQGRKHSAALEKKLGTENTVRFIELHQEIANEIQQVNEQLIRLLTLKVNTAWYFAGHHYVEIFQQLKRDMRQLDFTGLE